MSAQYRGARAPGRLAVVTGASSGIGAAACRRLRDEGWRVVGMARRRSAHADLSIRVDVADAPAMGAAFAGIDPADVVIHAAGVIEPIAPLVTSDPGDWGSSLQVNLLGTYHVLRFALPAMQERGGGLIVHVSSGAAAHVVHSWSAYCAGKAGAEHLVRVAAREVEGTGVGVCAFNPGITETNMQEVIRATDFAEQARFVRAHEEGTARTVDEVAAALAGLARSDPVSLNGRTLSIDDVS